MSASVDYSPVQNLKRSEAASDAISSTADHIGKLFSNFHVDDESYIVSMFDSELDHLLGPQSVMRLLEHPEVVAARRDAVNWILKVHGHYKFRPETACLSVHYLDQFLSTHTLSKLGGWSMQLLAITCLSLAAKLEETSVPILLDLQTSEPRFLFKPSTVQRMELLVMSSLKWRLRSITPFCFLHYFAAKLAYLSPNCSNFSCILSYASDLVINTCRVINFLDYAPSTIAAAALLWVTNKTIDDRTFGCFHERLNKELVKRCYDLIKRSMPKWSEKKKNEA